MIWNHDMYRDWSRGQLIDHIIDLKKRLAESQRAQREELLSSDLLPPPERARSSDITLTFTEDECRTASQALKQWLEAKESIELHSPTDSGQEAIAITENARDKLVHRPATAYHIFGLARTEACMMRDALRTFGRNMRTAQHSTCPVREGQERRARAASRLYKELADTAATALHKIEDALG